MNEAEVKAESRLQAIEYLLVKLYAAQLLQMSDPELATDLLIRNTLDGLNKTTIPGVDPALSDLASGEMHDAIERLLEMVREMVETSRA